MIYVLKRRKTKRNPPATDLIQQLRDSCATDDDDDDVFSQAWQFRWKLGLFIKMH